MPSLVEPADSLAFPAASSSIAPSTSWLRFLPLAHWHDRPGTL